MSKIDVEMTVYVNGTEYAGHELTNIPVPSGVDPKTYAEHIRDILTDGWGQLTEKEDRSA